jgi:hypothetical protein
MQKQEHKEICLNPSLSNPTNKTNAREELERRTMANINQ